MTDKGCESKLSEAERQFLKKVRASRKKRKLRRHCSESYCEIQELMAPLYKTKKVN